MVGRALDGHRDEVAGLACIGVGLVVGLGAYADRAGPAGRLAADLVGALLGRGRLVVPVALVAAGVLLVAGPPGEHSVDPPDPSGASVPDAPRSRYANVWVGGLAVALAALGLAHLAGGRPALDGPVDDLARAGGLAGLAIAGPLAAALAPVGAGLVLAAVALAGLVVLTQVSVRAAADRAAAGLRPTTAVVRSWASRLFMLGSDVAADPDVTIGSGVVPVLYDQDAVVDPGADDAEAPDKATGTGTDSRRRRGRAGRFEAAEGDGDADEETASGQLAIDLGPAAAGARWTLPPAGLLARSAAQSVDTEAVGEAGRTLERALAQHGVETRLVGMVVGPSVTRFELELAPGVKVNRVTSLNRDIAYAMASPDVRILAPIPGRQAIGVEVPNVDRRVVALGDILASPEARRASHPLEVAIGRDINGKPVLLNLAQMPHILIAGATGAGKSSCINSLLTSILMRSTPEQVRLILVDPKRVEMGQYDRLPHLLTQVVTNPKKAANALAWAVREMDRRYELLAEVGFRDIGGYNAAWDRGELVAEPGSDRAYPRLPFILVVIDELADLMLVAARDVEESISRIAALARAVGIHLVIATQRPSVNVITGVIKANIPARLAFAVSSLTDSRVILDQAGAERLIGKGDMLLLGPASSAPARIQGCWVDETEVRKVAAAWKRQAREVAYVDDVQGGGDAAEGGDAPAGAPGDDDELLLVARELVVRSQLGSTSMLQRKLKVGFARAGRLMDLLEQHGVVGPSEGSKARSVLMSVDELEALSERS